MDEKYYRSVIDAVNRNEKGMWGRSEESDEGFDDFKNLWNILNDEEADVTPQTYFEAMDLCMESFFGSFQDHSAVWSNILKHYEKAIDEEDQAFIDEFRNFLSQNQTAITDLPTFYGLMHAAIDSSDLDMCRLISNRTPIPLEDWEQVGEVYAEHPELAAYTEILAEVDYDEVPDNEAFRNTIRSLYSKFGQLPEMDKLRDFYNRFC